MKSKYGNYVTVREILDDAWCHLSGVKYKGLIYDAPSLPKIIIEVKTLSSKFVISMLCRLVMGTFRYGSILKPSRLDYDMIGRLKEKLKLYEDTHNLELLFDIANYCLLEFFKRKDDPDYHLKELDNTHKRLDRR